MLFSPQEILLLSPGLLVALSGFNNKLIYPLFRKCHNNDCFLHLSVLFLNEVVDDIWDKLNNS